jgi:peptidoglycan hydrolase-like protein with peptidoglycan-binding domain
MQLKQIAIAACACALTGLAGSAMAQSAPPGATEESAPRAAQESVRQVQEALKAKGHDIGAADGVMGPRTRAALRDFQQMQGLPPTGQIDQRTLEALDLGSGVSTPAAPQSSAPPSAPDRAPDTVTPGADSAPPLPGTGAPSSPTVPPVTPSDTAPPRTPDTGTERSPLPDTPSPTSPSGVADPSTRSGMPGTPPNDTPSPPAYPPAK